MPLTILKGKDNPILRTVSKPVKEVNKKTVKFLKEMDESMKKANGVGIAAPQVGRNDRIFLVVLDNKKVMTMINPEITSHNDEMEVQEEGCLSLPGLWGQVPRYTELTVKYSDAGGQERRVKLKGFNARIIQHEIDHLNAKLFIDRVEGELETRL